MMVMAVGMARPDRPAMVQGAASHPQPPPFFGRFFFLSTNRFINA